MTNLNLDLGRVGLYALEPEDQERVLQETADEFADRYEDDLKELLKRGGLVFGKQPPAERLAAYLGQTLEADVPLIIADDYWELRQQGLLPPLEAERQYNDWLMAMAEQAQLAMGADPNMPAPLEEIPEPEGAFWAKMIALSPVKGTAFRFYAQDFRMLSKRAEERL